MPTDYVKAVYIYSKSTLRVERADGDSYTYENLTIAEAQQRLQAEGLGYLIPFEIKSNTAWGLLKSAGNFKI